MLDALYQKWYFLTPNRYRLDGPFFPEWLLREDIKLIGHKEALILDHHGAVFRNSSTAIQSCRVGTQFVPTRGSKPIDREREK